jgi:hypothetical protein
MKQVLRFVSPLYLAAGLMAAPGALAASPFPLQMELRVPFDPTAFPSAGRTFLMYELHLTNFSNSSMDLRRIEVLDADQATAKPLAAFEGEQIDSMLQSKLQPVNAGAAVVIYMQVALDTGAHLPSRLKRRVLTADSSVEGAVAATRHTELKVLGPPLQGSTWHAYDGPSNDRDNHHRRGLFVVDGRATISRRFATDWFLIKDTQRFKGDARDRRSYYSYGQPVLAVASGTVVTARDGMPDNVPGPVKTFRPALPNTLETVTGNTIVLDLGGGQFASYFHLQPSSLRVKAGERVERGDILARIGVSGDSNVPHLHFEVTTSPKPLVGEGVPYVIDQFRARTSGDIWQTYDHELPMRNMLVDFDPIQAGGH